MPEDVEGLSDSQREIWPKVAVIIVNWNGECFLERCLSSLLKQSVAPHEIILVDNASSDASLDIIRRFPSVRVLAKNNNLGFAGGNNLAIGVVSPDAEWIALLNPDAFPDPQWLEALFLAVRDYPAVEVFGSKLVNAADPDLLDGVGDVYHVSGLAWREGYKKAANASVFKMKEIFSPCAAAALYRKDSFIEANGFDEDFFCYLEDVDLGFRLRLLGCCCLYVPESVVCHIGSAVTIEHSDFSVYHGHRNLVWTFVKNMPGVLFWALLPVHMLLNIITVVYFSMQGQGRVILRAKWDAIKGIPKMWRKRHEIQANRRASVLDIWKIINKGIK